MSDYNAEPNPDLPRAQVLARNYSFIPFGRILFDEWNIDENNRVNSFADGTGNIKFKIKSDPTQVSIT